jgi:hypothetical protein
LPRNHKSYKGHLIELLDNNKIHEAGQTVIYDKEFCMNRIAQLSEYDVTLCYNLKKKKKKAMTAFISRDTTKELK